MNLNDFKQRWTDVGDPKVVGSIDGSKTDDVNDFRRSVEQPTASQPVRLRPKYVPEADSDLQRGRVRQAAVRALILVVVFVTALIVMGVMFDRLPAYLTTYVFDR